jgi:hypothetical protein
MATSVNSSSMAIRAKAFAGAVASMAAPQPLADRILEEVRRSPDCELDDLVLRLPEVTWEDVLLEVHRLSTMGQLQVSPWGAGIYTVRVINEFGKEHQTACPGRVAWPFVRYQHLTSAN